MSREQYCNLIDELVELYEAEKSEEMYEVCNLKFANVDITLRHGGDNDEDAILIYADYGIPPENIKKYILQQLMQLNFYSSNKRKANFGLLSTSGHIVLMNRINISSTDIEVLINVLSEIANYISATKEKMYRSISDLQEKLTASIPEAI